MTFYSNHRQCKITLLPALAQNLALFQQERKTLVFLFIFYSCLAAEIAKKEQITAFNSLNYF